MTAGTAPRAGVDLEPNGESEVLRNITFKKSVIRLSFPKLSVRSPRDVLGSELLYGSEFF